MGKHSDIHPTVYLRTELCLLALSRSDNSIEIWDVQYSPVFLKYIPPLPDVSRTFPPI